MKQFESETIFRANRKFEIEIAFAHRPTTKIIAIGAVRESESDEGAKRKARTDSEKFRSSWSGGSEFLRSQGNGTRKALPLWQQ